MAALRVVEESSGRMVLTRRGGRAIGALIGLLVFGIVACSSFGSLFGNGSDINPVVLIIGFVIGIIVLNGFAQAFAGTRVVLDANQHIATRTDSVAFIPIRSTTMDFSLIRDVSVTRSRGSGALTLDSFPIWRVQLQGTNGSTLIVNERGNRGEMDALAQKVSTLLSRPVRTPSETPAPSPAPAIAASPLMSSLYQNLTTLAQSSNSADFAPPIVATPNPRERARRDEMERTARGQRPRRERPAFTPPNTLIVSTPAVNPDAPFDETSAKFAADQAALTAYNDSNAPSAVAYTAPPILVMPQMPGLVSLSPSMDLPSFPPLGISIPASMTMTMETPEIKEVQIQVTPPPNTFETSDDSLTLYRAARKLAAARNFRDAQTNYLRTLNMNPANPAVQNDLGVTYYEQNKWQDAERSFRRAIALDQFSNESRYNLGLVLLRQGRQKEAQEQFRVGMLNTSGDTASYFRDALLGNLRSPLPSPAP